MKKMDFSGLDTQMKDSRAKASSFSSTNTNNSTLLYDVKRFSNVNAFRFKADTSYKLRLVPYIVDETHPKVVDGTLSKGDPAYVLSFNTHYGVGLDKATVLCPKGTYGKSCPICEKASADYNEADGDKVQEDAAKSLFSRRRVMYNIVDLDHPEKGVQIINESFVLFEKSLLEALSNAEYSVASLCVGVDPNEYPQKYIKIMTATETMGKRSYVKFNFAFKDFNGELDEDALLEEAVPLHKYIKCLSDAELTSLLYGTPVKDDSDADDVSDDDVDEDDDSPIPPPSKKLSEAIPDAEAPARKIGTTSANPFTGEGMCPHEHVFGKDYYRFDECDECTNEDKCLKFKKAQKPNG